jgi:hypothetical protein
MYRYTSQESAIEVMQVLKNILRQHLYCTVVYCHVIGNYTVREVLMKNRTRVWRNIYNIL